MSSKDETFCDIPIDVEPNSSVAYGLKQYSATYTLRHEEKFKCDVCCTYQEAQVSDWHSVVSPPRSAVAWPTLLNYRNFNSVLSELSERWNEALTFFSQKYSFGYCTSGSAFLILTLIWCTGGLVFSGSFCFFCVFQKRMILKKLPHILTLTLKRFKVMESISRSIKVAHRVSFPTELRIFDPVSEKALLEGFFLVVFS